MVLVVLDLLLGLYLLRRPLFEGALRALAARELSTALGAEVKLGAIGGNWFDHLRLDGVQLRGRDGDLLREVTDLEVDLELSPWQLLHGDLGGLRAARIAAGRVVLDLAGRAPGADSTASGEAAPFDFAVLRGLLSGGMELDVDDLDYGTGAERRRAALRLRLDPGHGRRHITVRHDRLRASVAVDLGSSPLPSLDGWLRAGVPVQWLASLGVVVAGPQLRGGEAYVAGAATLQPLRIVGMVALRGLTGTRGSVRDSSLAFVLDEQRLQVDAGSLDFQGVHLSTGGFTMPSPLGAAAIQLVSMSGNIDLAIDDLSPYRELLPQQLVELLPVRGRISAWIDGGLLHVGACRLQAADLVLTVDRGQMPLQDLADASYHDLQLLFALQVQQPHEFAVGDVTLRSSGRVTGTVSGSLLSPSVRARAELGPTRCAGYEAASLAVTASWNGRTLQVDDLQAEGLQPVDGGAASQLQGTVRLDLAAVGEPLRIEADVRGKAHPRWLQSIGADAELLARLQPFTFAVTGEVLLPAGGAPEGVASLQLDEVILDALPRAALAAEVVLTPTVLRLDRCELSVPAQLSLHGVVPLQAGGDLDLELSAPDQDVAFWTGLSGLDPVDGVVSLAAKAGGTMDSPLLEVTVDGSLLMPAAWRAPWPVEVLGEAPDGPWQLRLRAHHDAAGITVDDLQLASTAGDRVELQLQASGPVPLRLRPGTGIEALSAAQPFELAVTGHGSGPDGLDLPWQLAAQLQVDGDRATLAPLRFAAGPGSLAGTAQLAAGWQQLLAPSTDWSAIAVEGKLQLAGLRLEQMPARFLGLSTAEGGVGGEVTLAGTVTAPVPHLSLDLKDAQLRVPGMPRITALSAHLEGDPHQLALVDLKAQMGAAPVALTAALQSDDPSWSDPQRITVSGHLTGDQALVVNTPQLKLRGDVDLTLAGNLDKMQVTGTIGVTTGRFAQRITALPGLDTLRGRGGAGSGEGVMVRLLDPGLGERIDLDVKLTTVRDFQVRTHTLDTDLRADLRLFGNAAIASLRGTVAASGGTLRLPGANMAVRSLLVSFTEQRPFHPDLQLLAEGRRHGYRVQLAVNGTTKSPQIVLTSTPALPAEDLLVLVSTGVLPERLANQDTRAQASLVGAYLAQELAAWYLGSDTTEEGEQTFFDRFTVEAGREISDKGLETILIEFRLTDHLSLQAERDVYEDFNGGLGLRFRFR